MPSLSVEQAAQRIAADAVITRKELQEFAGRPAVQAASSQTITQTLDAYAGKMTPTAYDVFSAAKAEASSSGDAIKVRDILTGKTSVAPALPAWLPANFDFASRTAAAKELIISQGEDPASIGPGKATKLIFTDVDLTLLNTTTPTLLKNKTTGAYLRYPDTGRLVLVGISAERDYAKEMGELKARYPNVAWNDYAFDFREFGSVTEILRTDVIPEDIRLLKKSDRDAKSRDFIITARGDDIVPLAMDELLSLRGVDINGVLAVNTPEFNSKLQLTDAPLSSAQKKAVGIAALIYAYGPNEVKEATFLDDTDKNLLAAMELLPKLFPTIAFRFVDVVHVGRNVFKQRVMGRTDGGELVSAAGKGMSREAISAYRSADVPLAIDPIYLPRRPRRHS